MIDNGFPFRVYLTKTKPSLLYSVATVVAVGMLFFDSSSLVAQTTKTTNTSTAADRASEAVTELVRDEAPVAEPISLEFLNEGKNPKSLAQLRAMEDHVREVSDRVKESTVNINMGIGQGTGVLVSSDGIILTAAHVIEGPAKVALITFSDGSRAYARTLGVEAGKDSGMLKIFDVIAPKEEIEPGDSKETDGEKEESDDDESDDDESDDEESDDDESDDNESDDDESDEEKSTEEESDEDPDALPLTKDADDDEDEDVFVAAFEENDLPFFPYLDLGVSQGLKDGQWVVAVGHPGGLDEKRGMVVRVGRIINQRDTALRTDCTLVGGDSGGPLVDMDGNLIAIHSRIGSRLHDNLHVPVDVFSDTWDMLISGYKIGESGNLGVTVSPRSTFVTDLLEHGPAARAGVQVADIIKAIDGTAVADRGDIRDALADRYPYEKVTLTVRRGSKEVQLVARLGEEKRKPAKRPKGR